MVKDVGFVIGCAEIGLFFGALGGLYLAQVGRWIGIREATGSPMEAARRGEIDPNGTWFAVRYRRQLRWGLAASLPLILVGMVLSNA